ncbi:LOW QUALITY PROTEIN: helicase SRCAP-like [Eudromia elegans]
MSPPCRPHPWGGRPPRRRPPPPPPAGAAVTGAEAASAGEPPPAPVPAPVPAPPPPAEAPSRWERAQADIAEQAKHEAEVEHRIAAMKRDGFWSLKRLPKVAEPARAKAHWDYLCEEVQWLAADFAQERRWKRGVARRVVRMVLRHHEEQRQREERARREEQAKLRRVAAAIARDVRHFWSSVEKVVQFKQQARLEAQRKKALDLQLDFIVGQTEKYSDLLSRSLNAPPRPPDGDFQPQEESDDEATIAAEERRAGNDRASRRRELQLLKREGRLPLEQLLPPQLLPRAPQVPPDPPPRCRHRGATARRRVTARRPPPPQGPAAPPPQAPPAAAAARPAPTREEEDEEETIAAQERLEGDVDHGKELDELRREVAPALVNSSGLVKIVPTPPPAAPRPRRQPPPPPRSPFYLESLEQRRRAQRAERLARLARLNALHCGLAPVYGAEVLRLCTLPPPALHHPPPPPPAPRGRGGGLALCRAAQLPPRPRRLDAFWQRGGALAAAILSPQQRLEQLRGTIERFVFVLPPVAAPPPSLHASHPAPWRQRQRQLLEERLRRELAPRARALHPVLARARTHFPDLRLIQYDCGKLQTLDVLLRRLRAGGHRVLIFTQMTRMLDVLEQFLTYHGHLYLRLDGSTRLEQRQALVERFNADKRIFCFILSTRSGGVGVNLAGADTVVFYDSDWNPTMDAQAQDRCHRIGQTRDVHIYRLISERTVEENILKKANQKRLLGDMAIEGGNFTTAYFKQQTIRELFDMAPERDGETPPPPRGTHILEQALCRAEDPEDIRAATQAKAEQVAELAEFNESIPLEEERPGGRGDDDDEAAKAEQEIAALVEQLTPIERYAMNFLEASLEDVSREELKQAEEQVEAARKDIDQAKDGVVFRLPAEEDEEGAGKGPKEEEEEEEEEEEWRRPELSGIQDGGHSNQVASKMADT